MPAIRSFRPSGILSPSLPFAGLIAATCAAIAAAPSPNAISQSKPNQAQIAQDYGKLPLSFEANRGQSDPKVKFLSRGSGYSLFLTNRAAVLTLSKSTPDGHALKGDSFSHRGAGPKGPGALAPEVRSTQSDTIQMQLDNANPSAQAEGASQLPGSANYFLGNDPANWHTSIPTYAKVKYSAIYPGVDLVYYGNQRQLEYDFIVTPGASPKPIQLHFAGAKKLKLDPSGDLEVIAGNGQIAFHKPVLYQEKDGRRQPVAGRFRMLADNKVTFQIGQYDRTRALVIDPVLAYSTYIASGTSFGSAIAANSAGDVYVTGTTFGGLTVSAGAYQSTNPNGGFAGGFAAFVTKINPAGTAILYSTYLGGYATPGIVAHTSEDQGDFPTSIAIDASGDAYIAGITNSANFPVSKGAFQTVNKGLENGTPNGFVTKLNPTGSAILYSTYLGGSGVAGHSGDADNTLATVTTDGGDGCTSIVLDKEGDAYVTGATYSADFPVTGTAFQPAKKLADNGVPTAFITKLNPTGTAELYSTYLGGSTGDAGFSIALDAESNIYVAGGTESTDFPATSSAYQKSNLGSGGSGFVAKLNSTGSALTYATYLGGADGAGAIDSIAVDSSFNAYLYGYTTSASFPTSSTAFQSKRKNDGAYPYPFTLTVTKLNPTGSGLVYSTYLGSTGGEYNTGSSGMAIDAQGDVYVTGFTVGKDFPVSGNAFQSANNCSTGEPQVGFFTELNPTGTNLIYSTYLGGSGLAVVDWYNGAILESIEICEDSGVGIALDGAGNAYITGNAASPDFPITGGISASAPAGYVAKFALTSTSTDTTVITLSSSQNPQVLGSSVTFTAHVQSASGSGIPAGSVIFDVDGVQASEVTLDKTGTATYATAKLADGTHIVKASYAGGGSFEASSNTTTQAVFSTAASLSILSGNKQTATYGTLFPDPLAVLVKDAKGVPVPGVYVSFSGPGVNHGTAALGFTGNNGIATSGSLTATSAGILTVTAQISGATATVPFTLTANKAPLTITANNATAYYEHPLPTLSYTPTGFVLTDTASVLSGAPLETTTAKVGSPGGTYPIDITVGTLKAANYSFNFVNGTLTIVQLTTVSKVALAASPTSGVLGTTFTLKALVTDSTGKPATSGTVAFYDGNVYLGTASIVAATGDATFKTRSLTPGVNSLHATSVLGLALTPAISNSVAVTVTGTYKTTATLTGTGTEGNYTLTTALIGNGPGSPAGTVTFTDSSTKTTLGKAVIPASAGGFAYTPKSTLASTGNADQVVLADVNGDGYPDLISIVSNSAAKNFIDVSLGKGDGTFGSATAVTTNAASGNGATSVAVADLNGDGYPDLLATSWAGNGLAVFLGKGNGAFGPETDFAINDSYAGSLAVADLNGDGFMDVVTGDYFGGTISVLLGKGNGTFETAVPYTTGATPEAVAIGDVNGDGIPDIAVANPAGTISLLIGNGDGTFQPQQVITVSPKADAFGPTGIAIADVNGDDIPDLVIPEFGASAVAIVPGTGKGAFGTPFTVGTLTGSVPSGVAVADVNRDGIADIVVSSDYSSVGTVLLGLGKGTFAAAQFPTGKAANSVSLADLTGNGLLDVAMPSNTQGTISVLLGQNQFSGSATKVNLPGTGSDTVVSTYSGNATFAASTSNTLTLKSSLPIAATPVISPAAGTYTSAQSVKITDATAGATIYYTTNETTPTASSTKYTGPITVAASQYIKAIAIAPGYANSAVVTSEFLIDPPAATPTFSPVAGTYSAAQTVKIADTTTGAIIYYTTNGTAPTTASTKYTGPITVSATETIEAIAVATGHSESATASAKFTIQ